MRIPRVCVLGANSFSGAWFVKTALDAGAKVLALSRSPESDPVFLPHDRGPGYTFLKCDINHDLEAAMPKVAAFRPALVVNFAAQSMVGESWTYPQHWYRTNVLSSVLLVEQLKALDSLEKYVHISTPEVYGHCQGRIHEHADYAPSTPYAVSRAAFDLHLSALHKTMGFPVVFTRAANVFGPCQQIYRIIPKALVSFLKGEVLPLHGGGTSRRSFIHIEDVSRAIWKIAATAAPGETFHISTQEVFSIRELVQRAADLAGVEVNDHVWITGDRPGKDAAYVLDSTRIRALGWTEMHSLEEGLAQTLDWVQSHFDILKNLPLDYIHKP